jgi:hypothetical protein
LDTGAGERGDARHIHIKIHSQFQRCFTNFSEIAQEITGREPILSKINITANVQENVILHYKTFYFGKTCAETSHFRKN